MNEKTFWEIIRNALINSNGNQDEQGEIIKSLLIKQAPEDIIDFERILHRKIIESDNFKVMAAAKIINGWVSDDSYLYFRCWLIGKGKMVFEQALEKPDCLSQHISEDEDADFERLLYVSAEAYLEKTGDEEVVPGDICCSEGLDYDFNPPPTKGEDWTEEDLPKICPNLWKMFNN